MEPECRRGGIPEMSSSRPSKCSKWSEASSSIQQRKCTILNVMSYVAHRWIWKGARGLKRRKSVEGAKAELAPIQQPELLQCSGGGGYHWKASRRGLPYKLLRSSRPSFFAFHFSWMHSACLAFTPLWFCSPNAVLVLHIQFLPLKLQRSLPHPQYQYLKFDDKISVDFKIMVDFRNVCSTCWSFRFDSHLMIKDCEDAGAVEICVSLIYGVNGFSICAYQRGLME